MKVLLDQQATKGKEAIDCGHCKPFKNKSIALQCEISYANAPKSKQQPFNPQACAV